MASLTEEAASDRYRGGVDVTADPPRLVRYHQRTGDGMIYDFLVETYATERVKVVSVWSEFTDVDLAVRPRSGDPRGRSVHEHMVHQCVSEDAWFRNML